MHICYIALDFHKNSNGGGIASYVQTLAKELIVRGHQVSIIAKGSQKEWSEIDGARVLFWPLGNIHWYLSKIPFGRYLALPVRELEWSYGLWHAAQDVHRRFPVDIFECCETGSLFIHTLKIPFIIRLHGEPYVFAKYSEMPIHFGLKMYRQMELMCLRRASMVTSPSLFQAREMATDLSWDEKRIVIIPNPISSSISENVDLGRSQPHILEKSIDFKDKLIILYTGRVEHHKGTMPLLKSVKRVVNVFPDAHYVIAGARHNSISQKNLNNVLNEDDICSHVTFLGHVRWQDLAQLYRRASIFVMPSYYETFGISVLEAMAFGLPVIATKVGGLPEVVEDGVTGILVTPGDSQALGDAVICLLQDSDLRSRMGQAGRNRVMEKFTASFVAEEMISQYSKIL